MKLCFVCRDERVEADTVFEGKDVHSWHLSDAAVGEKMGISGATIRVKRLGLGLPANGARAHRNGSRLVHKVQRKAAKIETALAVPPAVLPVQETQPGVAVPSQARCRVTICDIPINGDTQNALVEVIKAALAHAA
jgi:hypothetical protein